MELTIEQALQQGVAAHKDGKLQDAERLYRAILHSQPTHPDANHNLGVLAVSVKKADMALPLFKTALEANPKIEKFWLSYIDALIKEKQNEVAKQVLEQAKKQGVAGKKLAKAHNNLGNTLKELGRLDEAEASYTQAIALKPDYAVAFWNLHGIQKTIQGAEHWIDKCLIADTNHVKARLTKAALRFYQGDSNSFDGLMQSEFKQHPYMRSFSWAFSLPNLPELHFDKWYFFDAIVKKSIISKPFYEFGVWRASSFKYLIKVFKKGYGFDTFTGLPEDWDVGSHVEKKGTYTSDENVPNIKGGEFIVGKFEDTLPVFFSESRPIASVINFDADLYSSTICALNFSKSVMDKDTILIFDELIINKSWEQDEFKALNEFCSINHCSYEVIAISFFTKQVAVKLIGI